MELTVKQDLIRNKQREMSGKELARDLKVSKRRVNQVWHEYKETGKNPEIGKNIGRSKKRSQKKKSR